MDKFVKKDCPTHGFTTFVKYGKEPHHRCRRCNTERVALYKKRLKQRAVDYKGGACECCGYSKSVEALHFHHRNPEEKDFGISAGPTPSWDKVKVELDKCALVCANCHAEIHAGITQLV